MVCGCGRGESAEDIAFTDGISCGKGRGGRLEKGNEEWGVGNGGWGGGNEALEWRGRAAVGRGARGVGWGHGVFEMFARGFRGMDRWVSR